MYWPLQTDAYFVLHLPRPPTIGGSASCISALVNVRKKPLSTACGRCCAFFTEICSTTAVWAFVCRYSSGSAKFSRAPAPDRTA